MLRVAIISPLPPQKTGESIYTAQLIRGIVDAENTTVLAIAGEQANPKQFQTKAVEVLPIWNARSPLYPMKLLKAIKAKKPHLVHVHFGPHGNVYGGLFGEPMILFLLLLRMIGIPTTVTLHSTWMTSQVKQRVGQYPQLRKLSFLAPAIFKFYMRLFDFGTNLLQLSTARFGSSLKRQFLEEYKFNPDKIVEIPHPCAQKEERFDKIESAKRLGLPDRDIILLFGFIRRDKGIDVAISAMEDVSRSNPNAILLIAGSTQDEDDETYLHDLQKLSRNRSLDDHVRFDVRFIPYNEVPIYFSAASILLMPYTESVGASGPVHNYAGFGVPIVASNIGLHMKESLGGNILLFKPGNSDDLAKKLVRLFNDKELANRLRKGQIDYVHKETWELGVRRTLSHYYKTMAQTGLFDRLS